MSANSLALVLSPALLTYPFVGLSERYPEAARRIALALCYARDRWELGACLGYGDAIAGKLESFAVRTATVGFLDGAAFASILPDGLESLSDADTFDAVQGLAWDYLDASDHNGKVG